MAELGKVAYTNVFLREIFRVVRVAFGEAYAALR